MRGLAGCAEGGLAFRPKPFAKKDCNRPGLTLRRLCLAIFLQAVALAAVPTEAHAGVQDCTTPELPTAKMRNKDFVFEPNRELSVDAFGRSIKIQVLRRKGGTTDPQYEALVVEAA